MITNLSSTPKPKVKKLITLAGLLAATTLGLSTSQENDVIAADDLTAFQNAILARHNFYRVKHGVPPLKLDRTLNNNAQQWATTLASTQQFKHASVKGQGENLYVYGTTARTFPSVTIEANKAVDAWYNEIKDYNYGKPGFSMGTGHFTQVVWKSTTTLGCGIATGKYQQRFNGRYVVCRYTPPGNYLGQFPQNVLPVK
jgi:glioma pathogenesis-related protein 2